MKRTQAVVALVVVALSALAVAQQEQPPKDQPPQQGNWGWLGCRLAEVDEQIQQDLGLDSTNGVLIVEVLPDSPAKAGGVKDNDVVRKMDEKDIVDLDDLRTAIRATKPGHVMKITVIREKQPKELTVKLGNRPPASAPKPPELPN